MVSGWTVFTPYEDQMMKEVIIIIIISIFV